MGKFNLVVEGQIVGYELRIKGFQSFLDGFQWLQHFWVFEGSLGFWFEQDFHVSWSDKLIIHQFNGLPDPGFDGEIIFENRVDFYLGSPQDQEDWNRTKAEEDAFRISFIRSFKNQDNGLDPLQGFVWGDGVSFWRPRRKHVDQNREENDGEDEGEEDSDPCKQTHGLDDF